MPRYEDSFILEDRDQIIDFIAKISSDMYDYMVSHANSTFILFYKYLTHSDLATFGKATKVNAHQNNLLYYIDESEMRDIELKTGKPFQTAHQSCIGLKESFYTKVGLPNPRKRSPYLINDFMNVKLVNQSIEYFSPKYTKLVFNKLNKVIGRRKRSSWKFDDLNLSVNEELFTSIPLHVAVHGLGMEQDKEFHKLRHHMFKGDTLILLFEKDNNENNLFVLLEKNPIFFSIINQTNKAYENYQRQTRLRLIQRVTTRTNALNQTQIDDEVTRQQQSAWRKMLANEMMGYTQVPDQVFCPFTYITANFSELSALFVASHIKGFSDPNTTGEEKYDINNGILLSVSADALFDKHLITINDNKELIFSFLLDSDIKLKAQLLLMQPIFKPILNEKRMEYLKYHRHIFEELEQKRKSV
ncbi:MAG: HNH endonuclease [Erysipelotrichales bacterium]|nr:HNH endonuclease [Erysipelotrichales bacterium]